MNNPIIILLAIFFIIHLCTYVYSQDSLTFLFYIYRCHLPLCHSSIGGTERLYAIEADMDQGPKREKAYESLLNNIKIIYVNNITFLTVFL